MKKATLFLIALSVIYFSCNNKVQYTAAKTIVPTKEELSKTDTMKTLGLYVDFDAKIVKYDFLILLMKYVMRASNIDSVNGTFSGTWVRDTGFYIPFYKHIDSLPQYIPTIKEAINLDRNADTGILVLRRFIDQNPNYFKKDSFLLSKPK